MSKNRGGSQYSGKGPEKLVVSDVIGRSIHFSKRKISRKKVTHYKLGNVTPIGSIIALRVEFYDCFRR